MMTAIGQAKDAIVMTDAHGVIQFVNPAFERTTGYTREEVVGRNPHILKSGRQNELFYHNLWGTISGGRTWEGRMVNKCKDGTLYTEESTISPVCDASGRIVNYLAVKRDISEHLRLAAQLQQARKMEAVGLMAGGVAHDFNNMLTVILCFGELALRKVSPDHPLHPYLKGIIDSAKRSTDITRQLTAFARKKTAIPEVLDLNRNVESMLNMLQRVIGENLTLAWQPGADLSPVKMDPGQIEQILFTLCVNARDAIADVGKVTVETGNAVFDRSYCADHGGIIAGEYVLLAVSDNGCGMAKEIIDQVSEPFFTRKVVGLGTGLGLSTVYGIVKKNSGFIKVCSEEGKGTTFKIYLPRYVDQAISSQRKKCAEILPGCDETVLVVDDEPAVQAMAKMMLEELGYRVLAAGTPCEAIRIAGEHPGEIHLLITDVVMPGMNGRDLAERIQRLYSGIRILFMSGSSGNVIARLGVLDEGVNFIRKPFSMNNIAVKVQETLREKK